MSEESVVPSLLLFLSFRDAVWCNRSAAFGSQAGQIGGCADR